MARPAALPHDWWADAVPAVVILVGGALGVGHIEPEAGDRPAGLISYGIVALAATALLARRRWPAATLLVVTAALAAYTAGRYPGGPVYLAGAVALYSFAVSTTRRQAYLAAAGTTAILVATRVVADGDGLSVLDLLFAAWAAAAVLAADVRRGQRERAVAERDQREEEGRRRVAEDRLRIARDLHDSVAHSIATINVQSGVAAHVLARDPAQAGAALEAIRVASRDVLDELAAMLDVLRDGDAAPRHPTPDLSRLDALVESSRLAGLVVAVHAATPLDDVPPVLSTAAYRIVQEALTNVIRHADTDRAIVTVRRTAGGGFAVEVLDDGPGTGGPGTNGAGMGHVGIRERAAITGGQCEIGPRPGGGYRVHVSWEGRP